MPRVAALQSDFSGGEYSPLFFGRVDFDRYRQGTKTCQNYLPAIQGGAVRRPGSNYVAEVKDSTKKTRLIPFQFSVTQAYILEIGDQYIRFYANNAQLISGTPVEVATPYLEADLFALQVTQSADVLYIVHPNYAPRTLTRTSATTFSLATITFEDGPYLPINTTSTTLNPSGTSGAITITASASLFAATDVGRLVRMQHGSTWGWAEITGFTSDVLVNATVLQVFGAATAVSTWRLSAYYDTNYPATISFHEDRLCFAGAPLTPQRVDMSVTSDYSNFSPTSTTGAVADNNSVSFTFSANEVNAIRWLASQEKGLAVGTVGGEWLARPSVTGEAITPSNISAKKSTSYGSANIQPVLIGNSVLYVQRAARKVRELLFSFNIDGFKSNDMTILAEHIAESGLTQLSYQRTPHSVMWATREDGQLVGMTFERDENSLISGWSRHIIGGVSDALGNAAKIDSVAAIPASDATRDELWVISQRYIDGAIKRYVEYIGRYFEDEVAQEDAVFTDSALTLDSAVVVSGATKASPVVITATGHGFSDGDLVRFQNVGGMTQLSNNVYKVANKTTNTFELTDLDGDNIDGTDFSAYISGGEVRKMVTTISGLSHLEGETVSVMGDGAAQPNRTVSSGAITLASAAAVVHVGLPYVSELKLLRIEAGAADGTALGKTRRANRANILVHRSLGLKIGFDSSDLTSIIFRTAGDKQFHAPALKSEILSENVEADYNFDNNFILRQDQPLPSTILAVALQMVTYDRS